MIPTVLLLQLVLPLTFLSWLMLSPAKSVIGYLAQALSTGLLLLALYIVALWMLLPWWLPLAYGLLWLVSLMKNWRRGTPSIAIMPVTVSGWAALIIMLTVGWFAAYLSWQGALGRQLPKARAIDISLPLGPGLYLVANGGSKELVNAHMMTLNPTIERFHAYRGQSYGIDIIKIDRFGFRSSGLQPINPGAYKIYGEAVLAPCSGSVIASRNDRPDMPVPQMDLDVIEGNHVLLQCDGDVVLLAHFQPGSVRVAAGDAVATGDILGLVGNSGKSREPHLHISAQSPGAERTPVSGEPLTITVNGGEFLVRNDIVRVSKE